jgi:chromosome segregation protein
LPVLFSRLRIAGFKSFAEPVAVEILPGLTGIVGPNGCGKSNVVEALRWAMGENSARSLRGGEMDDVIFAGTQGRPSRNIAEVTLTLDEAEGIAPPPFHDKPELEISRKIEREKGSTYRVNGREVRARDVQTLFADLASGAHASAMVGQGRVASIVNSKPEQRRAILEEAAGITGLHGRRHEAELKLRAAEANLARAEDLRGQLETQLESLKRQARQATRYRNLSGLIRDAEAEGLAIQRARAEQAREAAREAFHAAQAAVTEAAETAREAAASAGTGNEALPALRELESDARTTLERLRVEQEQVAAEERRARDALAAAAQRLTQLAHDLTHAEQLSRGAASAGERLEAEAAMLEAASEGHGARAEAAHAASLAAQDAVRAADAEANRATEDAASATANHNAANATLAEAERRHRRIAAQLAETSAEASRIQAQTIPPGRLAAAETEAEAAAQALSEARAALDAAEHARQAAQQELAAAREQHSAAAAAASKLNAEAQALAEILGVRDGEVWPPMVDRLTVPDGLEPALGAALGEELTSAADPNAARHWRDLPPLTPPPALPGGIASLASLVQAPPALARALSQIGLTDDGDALQASLLPGQSLVSREGAVWRWDGYTIKAGTPTAAAIRLQQRNRLTALRAQFATATAAAEAAATRRDAALAAEREANQAEQQSRNANRESGQRAERARNEAARIKEQAAAAAAKLEAVTAQLSRQQAEAAEAEAALAQARAHLAALPEIAALRQAVEQSRNALAQTRAAEREASTALATITREYETRTQRLTRIAAERQDWQMRAADAASRVTDLAARRAEAEAEHTARAAEPAAIAARAQTANEALAAAKAAHANATQALTRAEHESASASRAAREAGEALAAARENLVRAEAATQAADHAWGSVAERILERFGVNPELPGLPHELTQEAEDKARRKFERLTRERDEMGPVNLRADTEAEAIETQMAAIVHERDEITAAIAKLRGSIGHLNREGRERLAAVFAEVDKHFQHFFARMFNGGRAHLALVGSDDPLEAGLEIYAQPPGKKLAALSLLSGGEQALTALSLIFAVFRCNPAPVCVLDEVDAPLDDANVERFCNLLDDMVRETQTRFLVVTHHALTMARMDRLYGVTMQERGVSRVLSVDLTAAAAMAEAPLLAAE